MIRKRDGGVMLHPAAVGAVVLLAAGCSDEGGATGPPRSDQTLVCSIPRGEIFNGGPGKDGIPALTNPSTTTADGPGIEYLADRDRVVGVRAGDEVLAVPLNILWWHEIVNVDMDGRRLAITHCPLTGSTLVFDRSAVGGAEFGVSGLLFRNNLMMYDRTTGESLWPQMSRGARCGPRDGTALELHPAAEMSWDAWRTLFPETRVVTSGTGFGRDYRVYPYGDYGELDNPELLFPIPELDPRRPPKERVLGIPDGAGGWALPFGELGRLGSQGAVHLESVVVFWDAVGQGAMAYVPVLDGAALEFTADASGIIDVGTGSSWTVGGRAVTGPLAGRRLDPWPEAYVSFWFAWATFQPETTIWSAP
jgi:hypothetical protein